MNDFFESDLPVRRPITPVTQEEASKEIQKVLGNDPIGMLIMGMNRANQVLNVAI